MVSSSMHQFAREKRGYARIRDVQIYRRYAYDFHDPWVDYKYDSQYENEDNNGHEDDCSAAGDADSTRESSVQPGQVTPATPPPVPCLDNVGPLPPMAMRTMPTVRGRSRTEGSIMSCISSSGNKAPMVPARTCNRGMCLILSNSSSSMYSLANSPLISPSSPPNVQAAG